MTLATMPAACSPGSASRVPARQGPDDDAHKRAIARAVWTDLLWLMPPGRTVTIIVHDGRVAVDLAPSDPMPEADTPH